MMGSGAQAQRRHATPRAGIAWATGCGRIAGACLALLIASLLLDSPANLGNDGVRRSDCGVPSRTDYCERRDSGKPSPPREPKDAQQRVLLKSAIGRLAPQRAGATDLYTIGVAGWADQDVFVKELDGTIASLTKVLPIDGRVVRLVNGDASRTTPLATRDNLAAAVRAVGQIMAKDEDILIVFMTSHGTRSGFGLQLPGRPLVELSPRNLASILDGAGIQNRVVVVSACYSGAFVPPLANDNTIVITAADARSPSFGCAPGRDWTFFGDALFNRNLRPGVDLRSAFNSARITVSGWELAQNLSPSNPQAHFGPALVEKLTPLFASGAGASR
jgi:Peptidase C13 family